MMGERRVVQEALFYGFSLERHVPTNHLLRKIDRFVDLSDLRVQLSRHQVATSTLEISSFGPVIFTISPCFCCWAVGRQPQRSSQPEDIYPTEVQAKAAHTAIETALAKAVAVGTR